MTETPLGLTLVDTTAAAAALLPSLPLLYYLYTLSICRQRHAEQDEKEVLRQSLVVALKQEKNDVFFFKNSSRLKCRGDKIMDLNEKQQIGLCLAIPCTVLSRD